jgi:hypothetical protein
MDSKRIGEHLLNVWSVDYIYVKLAVISFMLGDREGEKDDGVDRMSGAQILWPLCASLINTRPPVRPVYYY